MHNVSKGWEMMESASIIGTSKDAASMVTSFKAAHQRSLSSVVIILHAEIDSDSSFNAIKPVFDSIKRGSKHVLITDENVSKLYVSQLQEVLNSFGIHAVPILFEPGEASKSIKCYAKLVELAIEAGIDRYSSIISLGGGVVKDLAGMMAATLYRGLNLIHIPTTLLAQVDGAIDFNQALNLSRGKNLIGTFYAASVIWINTFFLQTLGQELIRDGLCESAKHALCHSRSLHNALLRQDFQSSQGLHKIVEETVKVKISLCEDLSGLGEAIKQYGHCIGHAVEHLKFARIGHGAAVAFGMCVSAEISNLKKLTTLDTVIQHYKIVEALGLEDSLLIEFEPGTVWKQVHHDKNFRDGHAYISLLDTPGTLACCPENGYFVALGEDVIEKAVVLTRQRAVSMFKQLDTDKQFENLSH